MTINSNNEIQFVHMNELNFSGAYISCYQNQSLSGVNYFKMDAPCIISFHSGHGFWWIQEENQNIEKKKYRADQLLLLDSSGELYLDSIDHGDCFIFFITHMNEWFKTLLCKENKLQITQDALSKRYFQSFYQCLLKEADKNYHRLSKELYQWLMGIDELAQQKTNDFTTMVQEAMNIMKKDYAFLDGVETVADTIGCSKSHLIRKFKSEVGEAPGQYLQRIRITNAKLLLKYEMYTIEIIANMVGYSCANYFCKVFQKQVGESPGAYRKRHASRVTKDEQLNVQKMIDIFHI